MSVEDLLTAGRGMLKRVMHSDTPSRTSMGRQLDGAQGYVPLGESHRSITTGLLAVSPEAGTSRHTMHVCSCPACVLASRCAADMLTCRTECQPAQQGATVIILGLRCANSGVSDRGCRQSDGRWCLRRRIQLPLTP